MLGILLDRFDLARPETEPVSGAETPGQWAYYPEDLGRQGAFCCGIPHLGRHHRR